MVTSAPNSRAPSSLTLADEVTITIAPARRPIWRAKVATPPPIPITATPSPSRTCPREITAPHAVREARGIAAASSKESGKDFGKNNGRDRVAGRGEGFHKVPTVVTRTGW
jgi:hypothetical protein